MASNFNYLPEELQQLDPEMLIHLTPHQFGSLFEELRRDSCLSDSHSSFSAWDTPFEDNTNKYLNYQHQVSMQYDNNLQSVPLESQNLFNVQYSDDFANRHEVYETPTPLNMQCSHSSTTSLQYSEGTSNCQMSYPVYTSDEARLKHKKDLDKERSKSYRLRKKEEKRRLAKEMQDEEMKRLKLKEMLLKLDNEKRKLLLKFFSNSSN